MPRCIVSGGFGLATKSSCSSLFAGAEFVGGAFVGFSYIPILVLEFPAFGLHVLIMLWHFPGLGAYVARS